MQNLHTQGSWSETQLTYNWMCAHTHANTHTHLHTLPVELWLPVAWLEPPMWRQVDSRVHVCVCFRVLHLWLKGVELLRQKTLGGCQRKWKGDRGVTQVCAVVNFSLKLWMFVLEIEEESFLTSSKALSPLALSLPSHRQQTVYLLFTAFLDQQQ